MDQEDKRRLQREVGERLIRVRASRGLTEKEMATKLGLSGNSSVNQWETGGVLLSIENALLLHKHFGVTLDWLYLGTDQTLTRQVYDQLYSAETEQRVAAAFLRSRAKRRAHDRPFKAAG